MRAAALVLALVHPLPVLTVDAIPNLDGSITIFWTLPADSSVVGVTVVRERLDLFEPEVEFTLGLDTSFTDFSAAITGSYRYWVFTRDAFGQLSAGVFVEVVAAEPVVFVDDGTTSSFVCVASASTGPSLWAAILAAAVLISSLGVLRPARWGRRLRSRTP